MSSNKKSNTRYTLYYTTEIEDNSGVRLIVYLSVYLLLQNSTFYIGYEAFDPKRGGKRITQSHIPVHIIFEKKEIMLHQSEQLEFIRDYKEIYESLFKVFLTTDEKSDHYKIRYLIIPININIYNTTDLV